VNVRIEPMHADDFDVIQTWRYEPPYDFYDGDVEPVLNPERFYAARDAGGDLVGFYYFEAKPGETLGLGLRPDLTGRGLGPAFFRAGLEFGRERFAPRLVVLNVAAFNERAIKVYERAGFRAVGVHVRRFSRFGDVEFVSMAEDE
jgi:RimJ/RimL family protein N-acetyltransferase